MKRTIAVALFAASSLLVGHRMSAQEHQLKATIPFGFILNDKSLPPGTYTLSKMGSNVLIVRSTDRRAAVATTTMSNWKESPRPVLVFHRYGDQYFLSEVIGSSSTMNVSLPRSKAEQRIQTREAAVRHSSETQVALNK